jgi:hypothetical protein
MTELDRLTIRRLAAEAAVDERSLIKRLRGDPVRGLTGSRCDQILKAHGIDPDDTRNDAIELLSQSSSQYEPALEPRRHPELATASERLKNCMTNIRVDTIEQLALYTPEYLVNVRNLGRKTLREIKALLKQRNLTLADNEPPDISDGKCFCGANPCSYWYSNRTFIVDADLGKIFLCERHWRLERAEILRHVRHVRGNRPQDRDEIEIARDLVSSIRAKALRDAYHWILGLTGPLCANGDARVLETAAKSLRDIPGWTDK